MQNELTGNAATDIYVPWNLPLSRMEKISMTLQHSYNTANHPAD